MSNEPFIAEIRFLKAQIAALDQLLEVFEKTALEQSEKLYAEIAERQQADERVRRLAANLEQRVQERTAQIESVNRELESFAYVVSHDLKAPLRAIASLSNWLAADYADKLDEAGQESLRLLVQRAKRMDNLIAGILEYSRVGRAREVVGPVDLNGLVKEVVELLSVPETVAVAIETSLPTLHCDRTRVHQVFQNLIGNAVRHVGRPDGRIRVGWLEAGPGPVALQPGAPQKGGPTFYVADNGPGIEARYFDKIFQMFQTLAPKEDAESTGVGLTIVKKIVEQYGGRVWVESRIGEGSTFWFTLPRATMTGAMGHGSHGERAS
jgi:two-component system, LuxR family, sensor kinase FixL